MTTKRRENKCSSKKEENNKEGSKGSGEFGWFRRRKKNASRKWRNYKVETLISIREEIEEEFSRCAKKQSLYLCVFLVL